MERANQVFGAADHVELATRAMGRRQSLALASQTSPGSPDSDTFHHHLHGVKPEVVYDAFQVSLTCLLDLARGLGWLREPVLVAIDRHNEPVYGDVQPWMVRMKEDRGTSWAHAYLTSQRLGEPRLTLDVQLLNAFRDQHAALADLLQNTQDRQTVLAYLLDKGFYTGADLTLLLATKAWFVVPVPLTGHVHAWADGLHRGRTRLDLGRFIATRRHRVGGGPEIVQVFVWEPDPDEPSGEALFVYACPHERPLAELNEWALVYRKRWGIETGYRQFEEQRLRTTSHVYSNRLFLTLITALLDTFWRLVRHARALRCRPTVLTLARFRLELEAATPALTP